MWSVGQKKKILKPLIVAEVPRFIFSIFDLYIVISLSINKILK